jgi:hypothetical protein
MMIRIFCTIFFILFGAELSAQHPGSPFPGYPGAPVQGYYQPVKIRVPEGTQVALSVDEKFVSRQTTPYAVGLLVGSDYRLRITNIPFQPGKEVFPTIKMIARTYPPQGLELEYPIQIDLTQEDIELALDGKFVTRVIYLENPQTAMPIRGDLGQQISTDVSGGGDPIAVAATMGQPVAIVRIGGRIPNTLGATDPMFFLGSPTWITFDKTPSGRYEITRYQSRTPVIISGRPIIPLR